MNWQQNLHEARKKLMQDKKKRREKGFICHLCGKEMSSGSKWYHLNAVHQLVSDSTFQFIAMTEFNSQNTPQMEPEKHPCETCGRVFTTKITLRQHMITHTEDRPFACEYCGKTFRSRDSYLGIEPTK